MHANRIVDAMLGESLGGLHRKLAEALKVAVGSALHGGKLALSPLARGVASASAMRHRIKRIDRLLGNPALKRGRLEIYRRMACQWLTGIDQVLVVVDWSDATADQRWHLLRASAAVEGRSVTLFEEIHPQAKLGNRQVHRDFLRRLGKVLPVGCRPIIMTDAGFHSTWFDLVRQRGWPWLGRIRGHDMVSLHEGAWQRCTTLYALAAASVRSFDNVRYVRSNPTACRLVLARRPYKGRIRRSRMGKRSRLNTSIKAARRGREPWLLACSSALDHLAAEAIVALYAQRMRIEQSFRDLKNERYGLGLSATRSRSRQRLEALLLIGHLTAWLLRLIGESARQSQMQLYFQSLSPSSHQEISALTLARRVIDAGSAWLRRLRPNDAIKLIRQQAHLACDPI
jgi:hypothetical protein